MKPLVKVENDKDPQESILSEITTFENQLNEKYMGVPYESKYTKLIEQEITEFEQYLKEKYSIYNGKDLYLIMLKKQKNVKVEVKLAQKLD